MMAAANESMPRLAAVAAQTLEQRQRNACHSCIVRGGAAGTAAQSYTLAAHGQQGGIKASAEHVARIPQRPDARYGLHAPVEAQVLWPEQQL